MRDLSEWWKALRDRFDDNIRFFSEPGRSDRERAPVAEFLRYLDVPFTNDDLQLPPQDDDVDVRFGVASFQNIELIDSGRARLDEVRRLAERIRRACRVADLEVPRWRDRVPMTIGDLTVEIVAKLMSKKQQRLANRAQLDALVYVNLRDRH